MVSYTRRGTAAFRKTTFALFAGGFVTFAVLYCTQPLMPEFTREFGISPTLASLSLSVTTATLAVSMLVAGSISEVWGRKPVMTFSLVSASGLALVSAVSPSFPALLAVRVLQGVVLSGLPAIAMAYLGEEIEPQSLGLAMGLYISGNSVGGMAGRIITGLLTDAFSWRVALASLGALALVASLLFWVLLPPSRNFRPQPPRLKALALSMGSHLQDHGLLLLYGTGFLLMGSFVTLYNYIGFHLLAPPYSLSQSVVGWIFLLYFVGTFSSTFAGRLADRHGRQQILWMPVALMALGAVGSLAEPLLVKILAIALFTFGFFGGHSVASSWVGARATHDKAQASALYLLFYYTGSSVAGTAGGTLWSHFGWPGVIGLIGTMLLACLVIAARLRMLEPAADVEAATRLGSAR